MHACDLTESGEVEALLNRLPQGYCPDALVHLASPPLEVQALHRTHWEEYRRQLDGGVKALILLAQPLLGRMLRRGGGRLIVALSTVVLGSPPRGFASYTVAKYALAGFVKCMAAEYGERGISVNTVSPGPMNTDLLKNLPSLLTEQMRESMGGQWIDPLAVARVIFWLAAEAAPEVTGCNVPMTARMPR
jgi:NAD(P)-dependent dehydrogenase (short-subunit alcohol dehydrogenase family)